MKLTYLLVLFVIVLAFMVAACQTSVDTGVNIQVGSNSTSSGKGRAVIAITDAAANMESVSSLKITVDDVRVHSATEGWVTLSSTPKTYDLLKLNAEGKQELLADAQLKHGTYDQMRLDISHVVVTDANGAHEAKLPSGQLRVNSKFVVDSDATSTATFDFKAYESLHKTGEGNGKYILAPVMQVETREKAEVYVNNNNQVDISGGSVNSNIKVGMDIDGNVDAGLEIPADSNLTIDTNGMVKIGKSSGNLGIGVGASSE